MLGLSTSKEAAGLAQQKWRVPGNEVRQVSRAQMVQSLPGLGRTVSLILRAANKHWKYMVIRSLWLLRGARVAAGDLLGAQLRDECAGTWIASRQVQNPFWRQKQQDSVMGSSEAVSRDLGLSNRVRSRC